MKIKANDTVLITKGKDRGRTGKVSRALPRLHTVIVEGANLRKRHQRPRRGGEKGKVITISHPLPVANVKLICSSCKKPARVGYRFDGENKQRICKKCEAVIS